MGYLSNLYGKQVDKAANLTAHYAIGSTLTFDSSARFPTPEMLALENDSPNPAWQSYYERTGKWPDGKERVCTGFLGGNGPGEGIKEYFPYRDSSTNNIYIDAAANMMYRWKYFSAADWEAAYGEEGDPEAKPTVFDIVRDESGNIKGYHGYVPCAGGGGGDLYWTPLE